jgi:hypothetical protein
MHAVAEIVIPSWADPKEAVTQVMEYFRDDEDGADWWDFFVIGGRFSLHKAEAAMDPEKLKMFHESLTEKQVTVSGMTCGKQEISPSSQIPLVDSLWKKQFPEWIGPCPLFQHGSINQYGKDGIDKRDICKVSEVPERLTCERLIIAGRKWDSDDAFEASDMLATEYWNRCRHQKTDFDGNVKSGIARLMADQVKDVERYKPEYAEKCKRFFITPDSLVVTVDFHN